MKKQLVWLIGFVVVVVTVAEMIGMQFISLGITTITVLPLVFSVLLAMLFGLPMIRKGLIAKIYSKSNIQFSAKYLLYIMLPLMARYGADVAPRLKEILNSGLGFSISGVGECRNGTYRVAHRIDAWITS